LQTSSWNIIEPKNDNFKEKNSFQSNFVFTDWISSIFARMELFWNPDQGPVIDCKLLVPIDFKKIGDGLPYVAIYYDNIRVMFLIVASLDSTTSCPPQSLVSKPPPI
jgi:hypothetical protein